MPKSLASLRVEAYKIPKGSVRIMLTCGHPAWYLRPLPAEGADAYCRDCRAWRQRGGKSPGGAKRPAPSFLGVDMDVELTGVGITLRFKTSPEIVTGARGQRQTIEAQHASVHVTRTGTAGNVTIHGRKPEGGHGVAIFYRIDHQADGAEPLARALAETAEREFAIMVGTQEKSDLSESA